MNPESTRDIAVRKRRLLDAVRAIAERDGGVPGVRRFSQEEKVQRHVFQGQLWPSWGEFLREAGLAGGEMMQALPDDVLLEHLADLTRRHGRYPSSPQLKFATKEKTGAPSEKTIRNRFHSQREAFERLVEWVAGRPEYADVAALLKAPPRRHDPQVDGAIVRTPTLGLGTTISDSLIPPAIDCLPALAAGDPDLVRLCAERGLTPSVELERRVALSFFLLGMEVDELGQGSGRVADGIARSRSGRWAVIYDAKVRRGGFAMGTEDRKFREYVERHGQDLKGSGVEAIYFAVVSSSFDAADVEKAREVVRLTEAKALALVEASALRALVELKLRTRLLESGDTLERVLAQTGIVGLHQVQAIEVRRR